MTTPRSEQRRRRRGQQKPSSAKSHKALLIELGEGEAWFNYKDAKGAPQKQELQNAILSSTDPPNTTAIVEEFRRKADEIYKQEIQIYHDQRNTAGSSDERWVESTIRKGTLKDRIAAMSVVVSQDPIHQRLEGLLQMCCGPSSNTRVAQFAGEALEDLFANTILPRRRKLIPMDRRPLSKFSNAENGSSNTLSPRILLLWRFEELIREDYNMFLQQYIHRTLHSRTIAADHQRAALRSAVNLLRSVPEGESALLRLIVDQLSNHNIHAAASHALLTTVQKHHPAMQPIIAREVQQIAHTSRNSAAAYRAVTVLMQLRLTRNRDADLAGQLLQTYFRLFQQATQDKPKQKKKKTKNPQEDTSTSKLICALLTGIHRAFPYVRDSTIVAPHIDILFKLVHTAPNQSSRLQSLLVLQQIVKNTDRFQRAVYSATGQLVATTKTAGWNLLYKSIKDDTNTARVCSMIKSTLIYGGLHGPTSATAAATLFLANSVTPDHVAQNMMQEPTDSTVVWDPLAREPKGALRDHATVVSESDQNTKDSTNDELVVPGWEMSLLRHHYHPTVKTFVEGFGQGQYEYNGDPLRDFSVGNFLDKLAYRNPKQSKRDTSDTTAQVLPVNDPSFIKIPDVDAHDRFFHHYFVERAKRKATVEKMKPVPDIVPRDGDDTDEEEEQFVQHLTSKLLQEAGGGAPIDIDDGEDGFDAEGWDDMYDETDQVGEKGLDHHEMEDDFMDEASSGISDNESVDEEEAPELVRLPGDDAGVFADASEYSALIEASVKKRSEPSMINSEEDEDVVDVAKPEKKRKKRSKPSKSKKSKR